MASLESLAQEIFDIILEDLEIFHICNLRLTSQRIYHLATQDKFKRSCASKWVPLTEAGLSRFRSVVQRPLLGAALRTLTLEHPADRDAQGTRLPPGPYFGGEPHHRRIRDQWNFLRDERVRHPFVRPSTPAQDTTLFTDRFVELLTAAWARLKASRPQYQLGCLRLAIAKPNPYGEGTSDGTDNDSTELFIMPPAARKTFRLAMTAWNMSQLPVSRLDIFCQDDHALAWDVFADLTSEEDATALRAALAPLQHLALRVGEPFSDQSQGPPSALPKDVVRARNETFANGIQRTLLLLPRELASLDFESYIYSTAFYERRPNGALFRPFGAAADRQGLCALRVLRLSRVMMAASDLYDLIEGCSGTLRRLTLQSITLDTLDEIERLFGACTASAASLEELDIHLLQDESGERRVFFSDDEVHFDGRRTKTSELRREGEKVRNPIEFTLLQTRR